MILFHAHILWIIPDNESRHKCIALDKALSSTKKKILIFFLFLHENLCCGYSLEAPQWGASDDYHKICFCGEIRKIFVWIHILSRAMSNGSVTYENLPMWSINSGRQDWPAFGQGFRMFVGTTKYSWVCQQCRPWPACAYAQAGLGLHSLHKNVNHVFHLRHSMHT